MTPRAIYLDMDGVLADFEAAMRARGVSNSSFQFGHRPIEEWSAEQIASDLAVRAEMSKPDFWPSIPIMAGAPELVAVCKRLAARDQLHVLTALPRDPATRDMVDQQKREWIYTHLGPMGIYTCLRAEKKDFARRGDILVDDLLSNCAEWQEAGGHAIPFTDAPSAIHQLMEMCLEPV